MEMKIHRGRFWLGWPLAVVRNTCAPHSSRMKFWSSGTLPVMWHVLKVSGRLPWLWRLAAFPSRLSNKAAPLEWWIPWKALAWKHCFRSEQSVKDFRGRHQPIRKKEDRIPEQDDQQQHDCIGSEKGQRTLKDRANGLTRNRSTDIQAGANRRGAGADGQRSYKYDPKPYGRNSCLSYHRHENGREQQNAWAHVDDHAYMIRIRATMIRSSMEGERFKAISPSANACGVRSRASIHTKTWEKAMIIMICALRRAD